MGKITRYILKSIFQKNIVQGWDHVFTLAMFELLVSVYRETFTEDNDPTIKYHLKEMLDKAIDKTLVYGKE